MAVADVAVVGVIWLTTGWLMSGTRGTLFWSHINPYGRFRLDMDARPNPTTAAGARP